MQAKINIILIRNLTIQINNKIKIIIILSQIWLKFCVSNSQQNNKELF